MQAATATIIDRELKPADTLEAAVYAAFRRVGLPLAGWRFTVLADAVRAVPLTGPPAWLDLAAIALRGLAGLRVDVDCGALLVRRAAPVFPVVRRCADGDCEPGCCCDQASESVDVDELTAEELARYREHGTAAQQREIEVWLGGGE